MAVTDLAGRSVQVGPYGFAAREAIPHDIYLFLIQAIRDHDAQNDYLILRWLERMQLEWEDLYYLILELTEIYNLETTEDEALTHVKWITGLSTDLDDLTGGLTSDELRSLCSVAVRSWKLRGTDRVFQEVLPVFCEGAVLVENWFDVRTVLSEWELNWVGLPDAELHVVDAQGAPVSFVPDGVTWDGVALHFDLTSVLGALSPALATARTVRVRCIPSRTGDDSVPTVASSGHVEALHVGTLEQSVPPSTDAADYRCGIDPAEYTSLIRVPDNGLVNRDLIEGLVKHLRAGLERYFVQYVRFLDLFSRVDRIVTESGTAVVDLDAGEISLSDAAAVTECRTNETGDIAWTEYQARAILRLTNQTAGQWGELRFYAADSSNFYTARISPTGTIGATLTLDVVIAGARANLVTVVLPVWFEGVDYTLSVQADVGNLRVFLDSNKLIDVADATFAAGRVALACAANQDLTCTLLEVVDLSEIPVRVGPDLSCRR